MLLSGAAGWVLTGMVAPSTEARAQGSPSADSILPQTRSSLMEEARQRLRKCHGALLAERLLREKEIRTQPQRALADLIESSASLSRGERLKRLKELFTWWAEDDLPEAVRAYLGSREGFALGQSSKGAIFRALAETDPNQALEVLQQEGAPIREAVWEYELTVAALAANDPHRALEYAKHFKSLYKEESAHASENDYLTDHRGVTLGEWVPTFDKAIFEEWIKQDPITAIQWLQEEGNEISPQEGLPLIADHDPVAAVEWLGERVHEGGYQGLTKLGSSWTSQDPESALQWIHEQAENINVLRPLVYGAIDALVLQGDLEQAASMYAFLANHGDSFSSNVPSSLVKAWSEVNPSAALDWAQTLNDRHAADTLDAILGEWAKHDLEAASEHFDKLSTSGVGFGPFSNHSLASSITLTSAEQALALMETHPNMGTQASSFALDLSNRDPLEAAAFISAAHEDISTSTVEHFVHRWLDSDPHAAADWVMTLPERFHSSAIGQLASSWSRFDREGTEAWIATLEEKHQETAKRAASSEIPRGLIISIGD